MIASNAGTLMAEKSDRGDRCGGLRIQGTYLDTWCLQSVSFAWAGEWEGTQQLLRGDLNGSEAATWKMGGFMVFERGRRK